MALSLKPSLLHIDFSWYRKKTERTEHGFLALSGSLPPQELTRLPRHQDPPGSQGTAFFRPF